MSSNAPVSYRIVPSHPQAHLFEVRCRVAEPDPQGQVLSLPAWIPGSYMIRDFAKNIVQLRAESQGKPVVVDKLDKQTWRCAPCTGPLDMIYTVYAWDLSVRSAHLDTTHGYFNGTSMFLRVHGQHDQPVEVEIQRPEGEGYRNWQVATSLPRRHAGLHEFGTYRAADYEDLVDHPVEMGQFALASFDVRGVPHDVAVTGRHRGDLQRLTRDLQAICEHHVSLFGELPVQERYVFLIMAVGEGYGGLEHRASCSLLCSRNSLPRPGMEQADENYRELLGLCSHEYFHTWNVKRIKPAAFIPYNLSREVHTELLWAFEGITSYYDELALVRAGCIQSRSYLELLGRGITRVLRGTGRFKQTVTESSFDAWTKFYKQDENAPNAIVSYYTKGALVALGLDLTIRLRSDGRYSLDEVMRGLWRRYGAVGEGVPEDGVERMAEEITGLDLSEYFELALRGTDDLPLESLLGAFGIGYGLRPMESGKDKGGTPRGPDPVPAPAALGVRVSDDERGAQLTTVLEGGAAQAAGLAAGDVIVALDGLRVGPERLEDRLKTLDAGERVTIHAFRRDELMTFEVTLQVAPRDTCYLTWLEDEPDDATRGRRGAWLGITES